MSRYEVNRMKIPLEDLRRLAGHWVAFTGDGSRVVASAETLRELEENLAAAGEDPQAVALERIEFEDCSLGGAGLS